MKKAIALGILLGASLVSFAFAANMMFVDKTMTNGEVLHLDAVNANGLNYYNISVFDANGGTVSFKLDFPSGYETGYLSIVETPKPRPEFINNSGIGWVSMTPGGEPIDLGPKSMYQPKFESGFISWGPLRFYHPSLRAKGGRYATDQFTFLEHGTYYYNVKVANPAGFIIVYQLTRPQGGQSVVEKKTPLVCTTLTKDLQQGDDDSEVKLLQQFFNAANLSVNVLFGPGAPGEEITQFGLKTKIAVERFQRLYGINPANGFGSVDEATRAKIKYFSCENQNALSNRLDGHSTAPTTIDTNPIITPGTCTRFSNNLGPGSKDSLTNGEVTKLQTFLQGTYFSAEPTGYFGDKTTAAIKAFQGAYGIEQLGSVGPKTRAKINELSCAGTSLTPTTQASMVSNSVAKSVVSTLPTGSFTVSSPWAGAVLKNDGSRALFDTIMWTPPAGVSDVSITLHDTEGNLVKPITSTNVTNPSDPNAIGMYEWRYTPGIEDGRYKIVITGGPYRAESGIFTLGSGGGAPITSSPNTTGTQGTTLPISKRWDDFMTTLTTRITVDLSGTQVGSAAFGSWRYYSGTPTSLDMLSVTATPAFTYPVGMVDLVVSPIEGSFTPISPECSLQQEQYLALGRNATMMRFTTKKFEELTEAQKRLGYCILQPNTKYYMNVRFVDRNGNTTCTKDRCGIYIDVNYSAAQNTPQGTSVSKSYDLSTSALSRAEVYLSGTEVGSVAISSWRTYPDSNPPLTFTSGTINISYPVPGTRGPSGIQANIAKTPGDFTPISSTCHILSTGPFVMRWVTDSTKKTASNCLLDPNVKYYLNLRYVKMSLVGDQFQLTDNGQTTSCPESVCSNYVDLNYLDQKTSLNENGSPSLMNVSAAATLTSVSSVNFVGLAKGANEVRVARLKEVLKTIPTSTSAGCANLSTTNTLFGPTTEECVKAFQTMNELKPTGIVDEATNTALNKAIAR